MQFAAQDQYAHASGIVVLTPQGKIARYFYGIEYAPRDLRLGLVEAAANKIGSPIDQQPDALRRQLGERQLVLGRVHHDLAAGGRRSDRPATDPVGAERRKAVLEHDHLERVEGHLGSAAGPARTQRAEILGQECPVVALGRVGDPFAAQ